MAERLEQLLRRRGRGLAGGRRSGPARVAALLAYLRDVHALEGQAVKFLEAGAERVDDEHLEAASRRSPRGDPRRTRSRIEEPAGGARRRALAVKDTMLKAGGLNLSAFFGAQPDSTTKLAGFAFAFEHLEVAAYELLQRVAARAGDEDVVAAAEEILAEERRAAERVAGAGTVPTCPSGWRPETRNDQRRVRCRNEQSRRLAVVTGPPAASASSWRGSFADERLRPGDRGRGRRAGTGATASSTRLTASVEARPGRPRPARAASIALYATVYRPRHARSTSSR